MSKEAEEKMVKEFILDHLDDYIKAFLNVATYTSSKKCKNNTCKDLHEDEEYNEFIKFIRDEASKEHEDNEQCKECNSTNENIETEKDLIGEHLFDLAMRIINGYRQDDYGSPEDSFQNIANYWNSYLKQIMEKRETGILAEDVAIMMVLFKIARLGHKYTRDSVVDICGYTALYSNMHGD